MKGGGEMSSRIGSRKKSSGGLYSAVFSFGIGFTVLGGVFFLASLVMGLIDSLSSTYAEFILEIGKWGLAFLSVGLGLIAIWLGLESRRQTQAISNADFHEKIAMMYSYMGRENDRISHDLKAVLELKGWIREDVNREFIRACNDFIRKAKKDGDIERVSQLQRIRSKFKTKTKKPSHYRSFLLFWSFGAMFYLLGVVSLVSFNDLRESYFKLAWIGEIELGIVLLIGAIIVMIVAWPLRNTVEADGAQEVEKK